MRTLVIAGEYPWPENSGSRIRLLTELRGLRQCGPTELLSVVPRGRTDFDPPDEAVDLAKVDRVGYDDRIASDPRLLSSLPRPSLPFGLPLRDRHLVRRALERFVSGRYDLMWCFGIRPWVLSGEPSLAPAVIDLDDLEDRKILTRLSVSRQPRPGVLGRARGAGGWLFSEMELRRWRRLYRRAGRHAATTVVCSRLDADRIRENGVARVEVVPNSYRAAGQPVGRTAVGFPPTVIFQGTLRYPPNAEAARFLAEEVGPELRKLVAAVRIRLVGLSTPALARLHDPPRVTVVGQVPDITVELARADLVVVPVRFGSGTRVKILEAFAHRVPVVSTTLGAEGLEARDGVHLLIGESASEMAAACAWLLSDLKLREKLTATAHAFFLERFQTEVVEQKVACIAGEVIER